MDMVGVDDSKTDPQPKSVGLAWRSAASWHCSTSSDELGEVLQWLCHGNGTMNNVSSIIIMTQQQPKVFFEILEAVTTMQVCRKYLTKIKILENF